MITLTEFAANKIKTLLAEKKELAVAERVSPYKN